MTGKYLICLLFPILLLNQILDGQIPKVCAGSIVRHDSFPSVHVSPRTVDVWLPEGYDANHRYPVLYMHDGQMLFDSATNWNGQEWQVDEWLSNRKGVRFPQVIVVGIWNNGKGRHAEYFPQKPFESLTIAQQQRVIQFKHHDYALFQGISIQSDAYLKFIVNELKPYIDTHYRTKSDRKHTHIMGSSMGGLISLYAICEYPEVFGSAACLSTHLPGIHTLNDNPVPEAFFTYLKERLPIPRYHRIYFDYGDQTLDALYPPLQKQVDSIMQLRKYKKKNWKTLYVPGADHSERAWADRLGVPLIFLLGKD